MQKQPQRPSRLNFEFPPEAHHLLKLRALELGLTIKELATQAILEKLEELEMQEDLETYDKVIEKRKKNNKTISHDQIMKNLDW